MPGFGNLHPASDTATDVQYSRLAAAFLDVVGFSALMGADELAAFEQWSALKSGLVMPLLEEYSGRYIKSTGDGLLVTFVSARNAVDWAAAVQRQARFRGEGLRMRVSLNWGDAIVENDDIAGDFVNIAARLEKFALPGGIIITGELRNALDDPDAYELQSIGEPRLHNIHRPVRAFHLITDARQVPQARGATEEARLPSIAILPFDSADAEAFLCSGIVDDLIVSLSGVQELSVTARSTVRAVGPKRGFDPCDVGEALAVDYLLSGTLQHAGNLMRIGLLLSETETGSVVSSERFEFAQDDLFAVQDRIVETIVATITPQVRWATLKRAMRKAPENFTAYEHLVRALEKLTILDRKDFEEARVHLEHAIEADPGFAMPHAWAARWRTLNVGQGWSADPEHDMDQAMAAARRAIRLDRGNALALATYGHVHAFMKGDYDTAIDYLDRAVAAGPNNAVARILRSGTLSFLGRADEACAEAERAMRLSPFDEQLFQFYGFMALACYAADDYETAIRWARRSISENPNYTHTLKVLVVASVAAGRQELAQLTASRLLVLEPGFRLHNYRTRRAPFAETDRVNTLIRRFQAAGIPD